MKHAPVDYDWIVPAWDHLEHTLYVALNYKHVDVV
jgi:hypothetical protein